MGNCIVLPRCQGFTVHDEEDGGDQRNILRVMKMDGKILEYREPILVKELLVNFNGCQVFSSEEVDRGLPGNYELRTGHLYYLLPLAASTEKNGSSKGDLPMAGRIKVVVSKKELRAVLKNAVSIEDAITRLPASALRCDPAVNSSFKGWRPVLETIPERRTGAEN